MARSRKADEAKQPEVDLLGQLSVELDAEYTLRPSRQAISNIERGLGKSLAQLAIEAGSLALRVEELGLCVAELMKAYGRSDPDAGPTYTAAKPDVCADLIFERGHIDVSRRIGIILTGALHGGYTASGEPKAAGTMTTTEQTPTAD